MTISLLAATRKTLLLLALVATSVFGGHAQAPAAPHEALLVLDMQDAILHQLASAPALTNQVALAIAGARTRGIPVIYVRAAFRKGAPEISTTNKFLAANQTQLAASYADPTMRITPSLAPHGQDIIIEKHRISAFAGSDLEIILRANQLQRLVLTGFSTSGVVLSTVREAADRDFQLTVLSDGCADPDAEVHRVLLTKVFPLQADVLTVQEWLAARP